MLFLIYTATGDFYEQFKLRAVMTKMKDAHELAATEKEKLFSDGDCGGYGDNLVFIREVAPNEVFNTIFSVDVPRDWFV